MSKKRFDIHLVEQAYSFEQKEAKWRKVFQWIFVAFLIAGALGIFGNGILSSKTLNGEGFTIKYERFLRADTPSKLEVVINSVEGPLRVSLSKQYLEQVELQHVVPQPESVEVKENELVYKFNVEKRGLIAFYIQPQSAGPKELELAVQGKKQHLNQFVYF